MQESVLPSHRVSRRDPIQVIKLLWQIPLLVTPVLCFGRHIKGRRYPAQLILHFLRCPYPVRLSLPLEVGKLRLEELMTFT